MPRPLSTGIPRMGGRSGAVEVIEVRRDLSGCQLTGGQ